MSSLRTAGPEGPTYWERLIAKLHLPYGAGALLLAAVFGLPGRFLVRYPLTLDPYAALANPFTPPSAAFPLWRSVLGDSMFLLFSFLALYMLRYMRMKLVAAESDLLPLAPQGEESLHRAFGRVSRSRPPIGLAVLFFAGFTVVPGLLLSDASSEEQAVTPETDPFLFATLAFNLAVFGAFVWVYFSAIRGVHQLGREQLRLKPFQEDPLLGARPLGALSLALAVGYFVPLALAASVLVIQPEVFLPSAVLTAVLIPLGVLMFFLPLYRIHGQMLHAKQGAQAALRRQFTKLLADMPNPSPDSSSATLADVKHILLWDIAQRQVAVLPTWPFDTRILSRLAAIIFSVAAILVARVVQLALQL